MLKDKIKTLRKEAGLTQKELGEKLNVAANTINGYETGHRTPDYETLIKMADYFSVTTDYLLGHEKQSDKKNNEDEYYKYLEKEYWELIKKLNIVEIKVLKSIVDEGISLVDINNALKEIWEKKKGTQ